MSLKSRKKAFLSRMILQEISGLKSALRMETLREWYIKGQHWYRMGGTLRGWNEELPKHKLEGFEMGWLADEAVEARGMDLAPLGTQYFKAPVNA